MTWYIPYAKLSQTQQACIESVTRNIVASPHFISGFAGSGKSVVLAHAMERLRSDNPNASFVFLSYTNALVGMAKSALESGWHGIATHGIEFSTVHRFMNRSRDVDFVFVDEVQDLEVEWLKLIKLKAKHVVLAGDYEQTIYERGATKEDMFTLFGPRSHELREVFRLTPALKRVALAINPSAGRIVEADPVNSVDANIRELVFERFFDEATWVANEALRRSRAGRPSALLFSHHHDLQRFFGSIAQSRGIELPKNRSSSLQERYIDINKAFERSGTAMSYFGNGAGTLRHGEISPHCYLMTIHSSKGLDFKNVFLPSLRRSAETCSVQPFVPRVCFVGVTRCVENLFLSRTGDAAEQPFDKLPDDVVTRIQPRETVQSEDSFF